MPPARALRAARLVCLRGLVGLGAGVSAAGGAAIGDAVGKTAWSAPGRARFRGFAEWTEGNPRQPGRQVLWWRCRRGVDRDRRDVVWDRKTARAVLCGYPPSDSSQGAPFIDPDQLNAGRPFVVWPEGSTLKLLDTTSID